MGVTGSLFIINNIAAIYVNIIHYLYNLESV